MSDILQHQEDGVLTLTLNRVEKKNALTAAMYAELARHLLAAATDSQVRVALIQGHETVFSAGNDLADFLKNPPDMSKADAEPATGEYADLCDRFFARLNNVVGNAFLRRFKAGRQECRVAMAACRTQCARRRRAVGLDRRERRRPVHRARAVPVRPGASGARLRRRCGGRRRRCTAAPCRCARPTSSRW